LQPLAPDLLYRKRGGRSCDGYPDGITECNSHQNPNGDTNRHSDRYPDCDTNEHADLDTNGNTYWLLRRLDRQ
jgi:hypothetical protein